MKYRLAIFDFDGTLANSMPWVKTIMHDLADKYHVRRIDESEIDTLRGFDARMFIKHMEVPAWKVPLISNDLKSMMARDIHHIQLFDEMDGQLQELARRGVVLAVVSSNTQANVCKVLGPENSALFRYYECGASIFGKKSKFHKILKQSGIPHYQAICIGDEIRDYEAAKSANIAFGAVAWGYTRLEALQAQAPDEIFERVDEIAAKIA